MVKNIAWCLPRPRRDKYPGGFPQHFERRLLDVLLSLGAPRDMKILHPFGGKAEYGIRLDLNPETHPDFIADAHSLPFANGVFNVVVLDPPYSDQRSEQLYGTGKLHFKKYTNEAARVLKSAGFLVMYHTHSMPGVRGYHLKVRILIETRINHLARIVHIRQRDKFRQLNLERR